MLSEIKHSDNKHEEPDKFFDAELSGVTNMGNTVQGRPASTFV